MSCCDPSDYDRIFGTRFARRMAQRYRRRGLDATARLMVAYLEAKGLDGASVLEVGGGVGDIQVELLRRGAARTTNLELVRSYDLDARILAREAGFEDRMTRRVTDIAAPGASVAVADIVVLHRVVCCYPDYAALLGAAGDHAQRTLIFSYPPATRWARWAIALGNLGPKLRGSNFRGFAHPVQEMEAMVNARGLRTTYRHRGRIWQILAFERPST